MMFQEPVKKFDEPIYPFFTKKKIDKNLCDALIDCLMQ